VIADAYTNLRSIPSYLVTLEYFEQLKHVLTKDGIVIINILAKPTFSDQYSKHIDNTIKQAYGSCTVLPLHYIDAVTNILYICKPDVQPQDQKIYTDNLNTSTTDAFSSKI
jgi:spermidine synthase